MQGHPELGLFLFFVAFFATISVVVGFVMLLVEAVTIVINWLYIKFDCWRKPWKPKESLSFHNRKWMGYSYVGTTVQNKRHDKYDPAAVPFPEGPISLDELRQAYGDIQVERVQFNREGNLKNG